MPLPLIAGAIIAGGSQLLASYLQNKSQQEAIGAALSKGHSCTE